MRTAVSLALLLCLLVPPASAAEAEAEWPSFHGPRRDNKSPDTGLLKQWPEGGPKPLWTASGLGRGYSSVTVAGGLIYTAGMIDDQTYVFALDLDGKPRWRSLNGRSWESTMAHAVGYAGARSTPTYDQGRVYHLGERGHLAAFDADTGDTVWAVDLLKEFDAPVPKYGMAESVLIDGDRLFCCPGGAKGYLVCLDKKTGALLWANTEIQGTVAYSSLVMTEAAGFRQLLGMSAAVVFGVDAGTGKLLWSVEHANKRENTATDPIPHNGHVYASSGYGKGSRLVRLRPGEGSVKAETVWANDLLDNHHGGVILLDGHLYGAGHESRGWFCLNLMTGKPAWNARGKGSLTHAEGLLYFLDERGTVSLVEPTPDEYRAVSSFSLPRGGEGLYWAHPVVCGGRLYVRHMERLFAYDIRAK